MTYFVTALTNDPARLIAHELRTSDPFIADVAAQIWAERGFVIVRGSEA